MTKSPRLSSESPEEIEFVRALAERFAYIRKERDLTLLEVSKLSGLSKSFIFFMETEGSNITLLALRRLCGAFGVEIRDVFPPSRPDVDLAERIAEVRAELADVEKRLREQKL